ncbi:MAG: sigma-54 dependent transcriptional regulator [Ignavibacteriaceae bacterium]
MNKREKILIVDDEKIIRESLYHWFEDDGYTVEAAESGESALKKFLVESSDLLLVDLKMPGMGGLELLKEVKKINPETIVIMITAYASVNSAIAAIKDGAYDYVTKPIDPDDLANLVSKAFEQKNLRLENKMLKNNIDEISGSDSIIGENPAMKKVHEQITTAAQNNTDVMIRGESGTGKESTAKAIHNKSIRKYFPFVSVKCGALTESMLRSELFGEEAGTAGNQITKKGKFEIVDGGTLYIDEVSSISPKMQVEILNVLETNRFTRVGGNEPIQTNFRLISAANENIERLIKEDKFRQDLYYKLNVFTIELPPLRERKDDILLLANEFIKKFTKSISRPAKEISQEAADFLINYDWPGNVRELENAIERALVVGKSETIIVDDLPFRIASVEFNPEEDKESLSVIEKKHILRVLNKNKWNISRSAQVLEIDRVTLYNKINKYNLRSK